MKPWQPPRIRATHHATESESDKTDRKRRREAKDAKHRFFANDDDANEQHVPVANDGVSLKANATPAQKTNIMGAYFDPSILAIEIVDTHVTLEVVQNLHATSTVYYF